MFGQPRAERSLPESENGLKALLVVALPVFFLFLGANAIWDANEAFYVETPRQMVQSGDYVNPSFNGLPRFNKPVLSYWIVAGLYKLFGISVEVERVGIAFGALGIILAAFLIGRALRGPPTGWLAALIVATAPRVVMHSRRIFIDVYVTAFMSLALAGFVLALRYPEHRRRWLVMMYVALGLGVLTKGPVAIALPVLACGLWLLLERRWRDLGSFMIPAGVAIIAAIVLPWCVAVYRQHGWTYIAQFIFGENLERFATPMTPAGRDLWFYLPVLLTDLFPWAPLVVLPLFTGWRRAGPGESATHASIRRLLWIWIVGIVAFFSLSKTKEDLYIFPVVAAVAVLVADLLTSEDGLRRRATGAIFVCTAAICVVLAAGVWWWFRDGYYRFDAAVPVAAVLGAGALGAIALWLRGRRALAIATLAAGFIAFNYQFVGRVLPDVERLKPVPPLARTFTSRAAPDAKLAQLGMSLPSLTFYLNRPVPELLSSIDAVDLLGGAPEAWLVTNEETWNVVRAQVPAACLADRRPLFAFDSAKLSDLLHGTPPPEALLATNKCGR